MTTTELPTGPIPGQEILPGMPEPEPDEFVTITVREHQRRIRRQDLASSDLAAHARIEDPDTSHEAAETVRVTRGVRVVLLVLDRHRYRLDFGQTSTPALTDEEIHHVATEVLGMKATPSGLRTARVAAARLGLVEEGPDGTTSTGRRARTWKAADLARTEIPGISWEWTPIPASWLEEVASTGEVPS